MNPEETIVNMQRVITDFITHSREHEKNKQDHIDALQWRLHKAYQRIDDLEKLIEELSEPTLS